MTRRNGHSGVEDKIKELMISQLNVSRAALESCSSATALLGSGVGLDSVETMALVVAIEEEFDISVPDTDLNPTLFENLGSLARYVSTRIADRR